MKIILLRTILLFFPLSCQFTVYGQIITTVAGGVTGHGAYWGDGGPATLATISGYNAVVDKFGNIYITDGNKVRKVDAITGVINTVAGTGIAGYNGDNILATDAQLNIAGSVSVDTIGNFYISDLNNYRIRKVDVSTGIITTFAGSGILGTTGDGGPATSATIWGGFTTWDNFGNMFLSDSARIRKVNVLGVITTIAGNGYGSCTIDSMLATANSISSLGAGIWTDIQGDLYFSTYDSCFSVHKISNVTGMITKVAGTGYPIGAPYSGDGITATSCHIAPWGIAIDGVGNLYIADPTNEIIEKVDTFGVIRKVAGTGVAGFSGDNGSATDAQINYPEFVAVDKCGNLYISDFVNKRIRKVAFNPACWPESVEKPAKTTVTSIYPNPAYNNITIIAPVQITNVSITNMLGQQVYTHTYSTSKAEVDVSNLPQGVYTVRVNNTYVQKLVKE